MLDQDETDPTVERIALALRRPVDFGPDVDRAVMAAIRAAPLMVTPAAATVHRLPARRGAWAWLVRPRSVRLAVSPLGAVAAAGITIAALFGLRRELASRHTDEFRLPGSPTGEFAAVPAARPAAPAHDTVYVTRFVLVAPAAKAVSLVGDFNDWDHGKTPLMQVDKGTGMWSVEVPLTPGRYSYAFLVDGKQWMADPAAPPAIGDDFGRPNSVVTVREGMST